MARIARNTVLAVTLLCASACAAAMELTPSDADIVLSRLLLDAPNPAQPGTFRVLALCYGSGTDRRRSEYRDSVAFTTGSVDASKLVSLGDQASSRNRYWGFTPKHFPLNGRVWYPDGDGPFPLVLIVHGNHSPSDFSDPGYGYLGELLASRGFILTSVDMNFVNGGLREENDARGWLLLKHLEAWRTFNETEDNPFFGKVDMSRIALIGHSRGGEAVGHAAAFNRLAYYPDDASLAFDFDFGIRSVIAIAPVDGQYLPTGRFVPVENVNYMVFHGSHDGDVTSFHGLRQYHRVRFTDGEPHFKTAIYVYRANHGQWNTVWNNKDNGARSGRILNLKPLLEPEEQREFGKIYIGGFLEATLHNDDRYLAMFRDHRVIGQWLPKTMYVTRFQTSDFRPVATFEEDIDLTTGSVDGVVLGGDSLSTWKETQLMLRSSNRTNTSRSQENQAVWLGWNNHVEGKPDSLAEPASYAISLPESLATDWNLTPRTTLDFLLTATKDKPSPRRPARDSTSAQSAETPDSDGASRRSEKDETDGADDPIDLTVVATDADGVSATVLLGRYGPIRKPLEISILRRRDLERQRFPDNYDLVLQSYSIQLQDFVDSNPSLEISRLRSIRFLFDRTAEGTVVVDDIGFSDLRPGFTRVSGANR